MSLDLLARALEEPTSFPEMQDLIDAFSKKTNVASTKIDKFLFFTYYFQ